MKLTSNSVCENDLQNKNSIKKINSSLILKYAINV